MFHAGFAGLSGRMLVSEGIEIVLVQRLIVQVTDNDQLLETHASRLIT